MDLLEVIKREGDAHRLRFVVIGGLAVNAHGYSRTTGDVDLLVAREESQSWTEILSALGYAIHGAGEAFIQMSPPLGGMWPVDLMLVSRATFEAFWATVREAEVRGLRLAVPSLQHLLALKLHALKHGLPHRESKDLNDLIHLVHFNKLDVEELGFRQLVEKYGTSETYERLRKACRTLPDA